MSNTARIPRNMLRVYVGELQVGELGFLGHYGVKVLSDGRVFIDCGYRVDRVLSTKDCSGITRYGWIVEKLEDGYKLYIEDRTYDTSEFIDKFDRDSYIKITEIEIYNKKQVCEHCKGFGITLQNKQNT